MSEEDAPRDEEGRRGRMTGPAIRWVLGLLALLGLALLWRALPVSDWVDQRVLPWIDRAGAFGYVGFAALYATAVVLMVPGSALTLASGYLFGPLLGAGLAVLSATIGAAIAFLIARRIARAPVRRLVEADRRFRAVDRAVADRGGWVVLLLRLTPLVPFNLLNYGLGLTGVRFGSYLLATVVGLIPGGAAVAFIGASAGDRRPGDLGWGWWAFIVTSTLLAAGVIGWIAGRALVRAGAEPEAVVDPPPGELDR